MAKIFNMRSHFIYAKWQNMAEALAAIALLEYEVTGYQNF